MEQREVMIELDAERASEFAAALRAQKVDIEGPDRIDSLTGIELAAIIVYVTPVVAPFVIKLVQELKDRRAKIRIGDKVLYMENATKEQLIAFLSVLEKPK